MTSWRNRIVDRTEERPDQLVANPRNWRIHPHTQEEALVAVLDRVGWVTDVIANRRTGYVVDGHLRVLAAMSRGEETVPVTWVDLDPGEEELILATFDPLTGLAVADQAQLDSLIGDLHMDIPDIGDLLGSLNLIGPELAETQRGRDPIPDEPPDKPATELGDIWRLGDHVVVCGDSLKLDIRAVYGGPVDMVLTDPPYAIFGSSTGVASDVADDKMVRPFFAALARQLAHVLPYGGHAYVHCDWRSWAALWDGFAPGGMSVRNMLVWDKGGGQGANYVMAHELIAFAHHLPKTSNTFTGQTGVEHRPVHRPNVIRLGRPRGDDRLHNAAKPVEMLEEFIEASSDPGGSVCDLFAGSGSTLIAAENMGRRCVAIEVDPGWCDVIVNRWQTLTGRQAQREPGAASGLIAE